ncbi:MAG: heparinase II/III family protein [Clostridia bacterium]|nr:heparinase II/III family protein [Clostridia bacterium]
MAETVAEDRVLYDLSKENDILASLQDTGLANVSVAEAPDKNGSKALKWTDQPKGNWLRFKNLPVTDMNSYNTMEISMYSAKNSGDTIRFVFASENNATASRDYFSGDLTLDWEGEWKNIRLRIGENGNMSDAGVPLGWDQLTGLEFWYNADDETAASEVYIDRITLKNIDYSYLWEEEQYVSPAPITDKHYDFTTKINARFPNHQHPRLLVTQEDIDFIKREKENDDYLRRAFPKLIATCDTYAGIIDTADDTITTATRAATLALGYALTENQEYADKVWEKMLTLTKECNSWEPGDASALSIGDTARYVGLTYDLMYNYWNEEQKRIVRNAIVLYALNPLRPTVLSGTGLAVQENNWNPVVFSGLGVAALAIADANGYADTANQFLNRIPNFFQHCFKHYAPDGAGFEGTGYWHYTMLGYLPYEAAMCHSIGEEDYENYTLLNEYGLEQTGDFMIHMVGDTLKSFNFYDGHEQLTSTAADFWLARYFDRPEFGGYLYEVANAEPWAMLLYRPDARYQNWRDNMVVDYQADGTTQAGAMRTGFTEKNGFYVGYKGGENGSASHGQLDIGNFVLESIGQRWVSVIPSEDYEAPEMFGYLRYSYYGNRAEGNNTLVIDPGVDQSPDENEGYPVDQAKDAYCRITTTKSSPTASYAIVDMTDAYRESAESVQRGFGLIADKNAFLLQDEIKLKKSAEVYSFMHTQADVELSADRRSAIMSHGGKQMKATLLSPQNATLRVMDAVPLPTSPEAQNLNRDAYKKLTVKAQVDSEATISVLFTPYYGEGGYEYMLENVVALNDWDAFTTEQMAMPKIQGDTNLYRSPVGRVQTIQYGVVGNLPETIKNSLSWSLDGAPEGVSVDDSGVLSMSGDVSSGTFTLCLNLNGEELATKEVAILAKPEKYSDLFDRYYEDFEVYKEDATIVMKGSPQRPSIKYTDPSGTGLIVGKEEDGNTYAKATGLCYWSSNATFMFNYSANDGQRLYLPDASVVTVEGRFMIENPSSTEQSLMWFENAGVRLGYKASSSPEKADVYSHGTKIATVDTNEWFDLRVEFDHTNVTYDAYLNNIKVVDARAMGNNLYVGAGTRGNGFYIGASVDDLAMYSGRNVAVVETAGIYGDATIYRAPVGIIQKLQYTTDTDLTHGTKWYLKDAPEGVTIDQNGVLKVPGSVPAGTFEIQLMNVGLLLGAKTITIPEQPEKWVKGTSSGRYYEDFTRYQDATITTGTVHGDIKLDSAITATTEADGNVYAKASISDGLSWGSSGTALKLLNSWNDGNIYLPDASEVVIEGRFKAEIPTAEKRWPVMWHMATGINISYELAEEEAYAKLVHTNDGTDDSTTIAYVPKDTWFSLRVELNYTKGTYSVFVNDTRVVEGRQFTNTETRLNKGLVIGTSVDDLAMYSGTKDATVMGDQMTIVKNGVVVDSTTRRFDFAEDTTLNLSISKSMKNTSENAKAIGVFVAIYTEDKNLSNVWYNGNSILPEITGSFLIDVTCDVTAGSYAKIFLWDMEKLCPIHEKP